MTKSFGDHSKIENLHELSTKTKLTPSSLLFVNRYKENAQAVRSLQELNAIKQHLVQRQQRRHSHKPLKYHTSTSKILNRDQGEDDAEISRRKGQVLSRKEQPQNLLTNMVTSDPFSTPVSNETTRLIFLYVQHLLPLASTVSQEWDWIKSIPEIQSSPMLSSAISAYSSAFFTGIRHGAKSVVLPPHPEKGSSPLWQLPAWFSHHNRALTLLNETLLDTTQAMRNDVVHTILFLLRLSILLGDGLTANMHFKALRQIVLHQGKSAAILAQEMAVTRVNYITLFIYKAAMIKSTVSQPTEEHPPYIIQPDRDHWTDEKEWIKFSGMLYGRALTWHANKLQEVPQHEARQQIERIDQQSVNLPVDLYSTLLRHYQIALYMWSYLVNICYDSSLPKIKLHVQELELFLRTVDLPLLEQHAPKVTFMLFFCGAYATRGQVSRVCFIQHLAYARIQVHYMRDVYAELEGFGDPAHCMPILLEEILKEIIHLRDGKIVTRQDIYQGQFRRKRHGPVPICYEPDLTTPIRDAAM